MVFLNCANIHVMRPDEPHHIYTWVCVCVDTGISPVQELKQVGVGVQGEGVEGQAWISNLKKQ